MKRMRQQMDCTLLELAQAEGSGDAEALQEAYEELFSLCYENGLSLPAVLHQAGTCTNLEVA
jgi:hypothetical protein